ncbi:MAG: pyruvate, phosphate dikinase [Desulfovibrionaceae bacterium]|nr:pyruvate, phosphate dikinase [Desulfovibrionaceae bacterium]MBF0512550.1 pyruvate, phosphate dikinase [Desulfovibrionaceae bacterium]
MRRHAPQENVLQRKYNAYRSLLAHNTGSLTALSEMEMLLRENRPFTLEMVVAHVHTLTRSVGDIVTSLNSLCGGKYQELHEITGRIGADILRELSRRKEFERTELVLPLEQLSRDRLDDVGGKAANYGEICNRACLPVSPGFAVTAYACREFLKHCDLLETLASRIGAIDIDDTLALEELSAEIRGLIQGADPPEELKAAISAVAAGLESRLGPDPRLSVRSSATCEDSESSFAGQYSSVLNVSTENILDAYKEVVASTFTPRAIFYRRTKGYSEDDIVMSVLCLAMVDAAASGVMYTGDPTGRAANEIIISAAWGLGVSVVDGSASVDMYRLDKSSGNVGKEIAKKVTRVVMAAAGGLVTEAVPEELRLAPCLSDAEIAELADYGKRLEGHYGQTLDIEWAKDKGGRLLILQARPLNPMVASEEAGERLEPVAEPDAGLHPVLLEGGHCASPGVASGLALRIFSDEGLSCVPEGVVLIAPQTSPAYVAIMGRLRGIVTDLGSVTGHMAAVAREFELPTLVATENATSAIPDGAEITIDTVRRRIYRGRVESLLQLKKKSNPMAGSPVYKLAREAMAKIAPLTLTNPHGDNFTPQGCRTLHDVIRLAHEISMHEMFRIGEYVEDEEERGAVRLRVRLPMIIYCVDMGGGLSLEPGKNLALTEHVASRPFASLIRGMTHKDVVWTGAVGMNMGGLAALMAQSVLNDPTVEGRFGGPNYAVISKDYLNFNARLGYHFAVVDSYLGESLDENYIAFSFKGGAADMERRGRRAKLIARILERLGLRVELRGDMIRGELKEGKPEIICDKLDHLGRLLGSVRLLDMAIADDSQIDWYVEEFFKGNYTFNKS